MNYNYYKIKPHIRGVLLFMGWWVNFGMTKCILLMIFLGGCVPQLDYFGNPIKLHEDIISLTKMRKDSSEKDKFYLTFIEIYNASNAQESKKERTLDRYLDLIMKYYGYTEKEILEQKNNNILQPRYYVTVKFN